MLRDEKQDKCSRTQRGSPILDGMEGGWSSRRQAAGTQKMKLSDRPRSRERPRRSELTSMENQQNRRTNLGCRALHQRLSRNRWPPSPTTHAARLVPGRTARSGFMMKPEREHEPTTCATHDKRADSSLPMFAICCQWVPAPVRLRSWASTTSVCEEFPARHKPGTPRADAL